MERFDFKFDLKAAAVGTLLVFVLSWMFDYEVLFLLGMVVTLALAAFVGALAGAMTLAERWFVAEPAEQKVWAKVSPEASRQSVAG